MRRKAILQITRIFLHLITKSRTHSKLQGVNQFHFHGAKKAFKIWNKPQLYQAHSSDVYQADLHSSSLTQPGSSHTFTDDCDAGFHCILGSHTPTPTDGVKGRVCPEGRFCVKGTKFPENCPSGTFSNSPQLKAVYECMNCTPGMFCNGSGLTHPSGDCWPRYYCNGRAEHPAPQDGLTGGNCTPGHYCPGKTPNPIPCEVS